MKRAAGADAAAEARGRADAAAESKRVRRAAPRPPPPPPPAYWQTSADGAGGGASLFTTRYMRRKLEYLMRSCATHPGGCQDGPTLEFKATKQDAQHRFLHGMKRPATEDPVFRAAMLRRGAVKKASQEYDSIDAEADQRGVARGGAPAQIHRELVVFEESQVRGLSDS
jgi:hypothetical protein